jgi:hypothetical protein
MAQVDKTDWFQRYYETIDFKRQNLSVQGSDVIPELDFRQIELVDIETSQHNSDGQWIKYAGRLGYMKYAVSNYNTPNADIVPGIEKYVSCLGRDLGIPINEIKLGFNPENRRFFHVSFMYNDSWSFQDLMDLADFIKRPSIASQITYPYPDSLTMSLYSELHNDFRFMPEHFNPEIFDVSKVYSWLICEEDHHGFNNIVVHVSVPGRYFYYLIDYGAALPFLHRMCLPQPGTLSDQHIAEILRAPLTRFLRNIFLYKQLKTSSSFYKSTIGLLERFVTIDEAVFLQHTDFILQHGFFSPQQATVLNVYMALLMIY